jgi:hypothetical protein
VRLGGSSGTGPCARTEAAPPSHTPATTEGNHQPRRAIRSLRMGPWSHDTRTPSPGPRRPAWNPAAGRATRSRSG